MTHGIKQDADGWSLVAQQINAKTWAMENVKTTKTNGDQRKTQDHGMENKQEDKVAHCRVLDIPMISPHFLKTPLGF